MRKFDLTKTQELKLKNIIFHKGRERRESTQILKEAFRSRRNQK